MTQVPDLDASMFGNDKIFLGIDGQDVPMIESEDGNIVVFEVANKLCSYNVSEGTLAVLFSFYDEETMDARTTYAAHGIKALGVDEGGNAEAIRIDNFKGHSMCFVSDVGGCVVPVMKLKNLTSDNSMNIYNSGKHCGCVCHNLHHSNNFFGEFIYKIIRTFWDWFSTSKYCDCGLRHY